MIDGEVDRGRSARLQQSKILSLQSHLLAGLAIDATLQQRTLHISATSSTHESTQLSAHFALQSRATECPLLAACGLCPSPRLATVCCSHSKSQWQLLYSHSPCSLLQCSYAARWHTPPTGYSDQSKSNPNHNAVVVSPRLNRAVQFIAQFNTHINSYANPKHCLIARLCHNCSLQ